MEKYIITDKANKEFEWSKWRGQIPYISFPSNWEVKIIPPNGGAIVRFLVNPNVSVYLDCYDLLACYGEPYWEIYNGDDIYRCDINDTETLIAAIQYGLDFPEVSYASFFQQQESK